MPLCSCVRKYGGVTVAELPKVSVIIPTYNHAEFLREALRSVCEQSRSDWEAIVVNNYSEDDTIAVVEAFEDPRIRLVNYRNHGIIAASRNYGISLAKGEYLAFLDSDDTWSPEKLSISLAGLEEGFDLVCHGLHWFGSRSERDQYYGPEERATFDALLFRGNCIATSATMVRRDRVETVGGFSEDENFVTAEDYHLWLKLAQAGAKFFFIDQVLGRYRFHAENSGTAVRQANAVRHVVDDFVSAMGPLGLVGRVRVRFRHGIIAYSIGRGMQANGRFLAAWPYFFRSLVLHPGYYKTYLAMVLNLLCINPDSYR